MAWCKKQGAKEVREKIDGRMDVCNDRLLNGVKFQEKPAKRQALFSQDFQLSNEG